jgi:hypothetical protein
VYYRLGVFAWIFEVGIYPGVTDIFPSYGKEIERLRWSDKNMDGRLFVEWQPYDHPQLGMVEIGGFLGKIKDPVYGTYTNVMCLPGAEYEAQLANHTRWHLFLAGASPLVRIAEVKTVPLEDGFFRIQARVENRGALPTYVSEQALLGEMAKPVVASISLQNATLVSGEESAELGHIAARAFTDAAEWLVRATGSNTTVVVEVVSEKGGRDSRTIYLNGN